MIRHAFRIRVTLPASKYQMSSLEYTFQSGNTDALINPYSARVLLAIGLNEKTIPSVQFDFFTSKHN